MKTLEVALPDQLARAVASAVATGTFDSPAEVVRTALPAAMIKVLTDYKGLKLETFVDRDDFIIGRLAGEFRPQVALNLDLRVAGKHARVRRRGAQWWIEDLGSPGGTFVNDARLVGVHALEPADIVQVGVSKLTFMDLTPQE